MICLKEMLGWGGGFFVKFENEEFEGGLYGKREKMKNTFTKLKWPTKMHKNGEELKRGGGKQYTCKLHPLNKLVLKKSKTGKLIIKIIRLNSFYFKMIVSSL